MKKPDVKTRGAYFFEEGPYFENEEYDGHKVVGRWIRNDFRPSLLVGIRPKFSISHAYIAELANGWFAVRKQGMNDVWYGPNLVDVLYQSFDDASNDLENRIEFVNQKYLIRQIRSLFLNGLLILLLVAFFVWQVL